LRDFGDCIVEGGVDDVGDGVGALAGALVSALVGASVGTLIGAWVVNSFGLWECHQWHTF
jgi:hypothetical protein